MMIDAISSLTVIANAIVLLLFGIFASAGVSKLKRENNQYYVRAIHNYGLAPESLSSVLVSMIGSLELLIALLLVLPATQLLGLLAAIMLLSLYLFAFAKQVRQGKADMDCGCAGPGAQLKISPILLIRNGLLILLACLAAIHNTYAQSLLWLLVLPLAGVFGLIYLSAEQLIANNQKIQKIRNTAF